MASQPQVRWQFVNISEPKTQKKDETIRRIVRANAMRDFRKKQKGEKIDSGKVALQGRQASRKPHPERQASAGAPLTPAANEGRQVKRPHDARGPVTIPGRIQPSADPVPTSMDYGEWRDDAYVQWPEELRHMLGNLESLSLEELVIENEEDLAMQIQLKEDSEFFWLRGGGVGLSLELARRRFTVNPKTLWDSGADPFNALPIGGNPRYNSSIMHHFVTVMALDCLPIDPGAGQNPLTTIWLPYAMQDTALFLSTLTFAAAHINILTGRKNNPKLLSHKSDTIKAINEKLQSPNDAVSNSTIGAVAMVAAVESIQGHSKELEIHMRALTEMVGLRGGLQKLGWSGVLHMFISWQDLLYTSILAKPPVFKKAPCCLTIRENLSPAAPIYPNFDLDLDISEALKSLFADLRYLTDSINQPRIGTGRTNATTLDLMTFSKTRTAIEHRILEMMHTNQKPRNQMNFDDCTLKLCRLAALIYIKCALHMFLPVCSILTSLKTEVKQLIEDGEKFSAVGRSQSRLPVSTTWSLVMCSLLAATPEEEAFFARRIAERTNLLGACDWSDMEVLLQRIAWVDKLNTTVCKRVWARVQTYSQEGI